MLGMCIGAQQGACRAQQGSEGPEMKGQGTDFAAVANVFINYRLVTLASLRWTIKQGKHAKAKGRSGEMCKIRSWMPSLVVFNALFPTTALRS